MIKVEIREKPSQYGDFYYQLTVPCVRCGRPAHGVTAASRKIAGLSKKLAYQWKAELECGKSSLTCKDCHVADEKKRIEEGEQRWKARFEKNKQVTHSSEAV